MVQLPEAQVELWNNYREHERNKVRSESLPALERFVASLLRLSPTVWHPWALNIAQRVVDHDDEIAIRFPLFRAVLFPALLAALTDSRPGAARWLAGINQLLYQTPACLEQLPDDQRTEIGLLRVALRHEPNDSLARRKLIIALANQLDYAIHEVPAGVLWDHNGASIDQCSMLCDELDEFCRLVTTEGIAREYQDLIEDCRLHFSAYPRYLSDRQGTSSYAEYLSKFQDA